MCTLPLRFFSPLLSSFFLPLLSPFLFSSLSSPISSPCRYDCQEHGQNQPRPRQRPTDLKTPPHPQLFEEGRGGRREGRMKGEERGEREIHKRGIDALIANNMDSFGKLATRRDNFVVKNCSNGEFNGSFELPPSLSPLSPFQLYINDIPNYMEVGGDEEERGERREGREGREGREATTTQQDITIKQPKRRALPSPLSPPSRELREIERLLACKLSNIFGDKNIDSIARAIGEFLFSSLSSLLPPLSSLLPPLSFVIPLPSSLLSFISFPFLSLRQTLSWSRFSLSSLSEFSFNISLLPSLVLMDLSSLLSLIPPLSSIRRKARVSLSMYRTSCPLYTSMGLSPLSPLLQSP